MNCPSCGFFVQDAYAILCPRCGQPLAASDYPRSSGPGMVTNPFSESPTVFSNGPFAPGVTSPGQNYPSAFPGQSAPGSTPMYVPGGPASYPPTQPPGGFAPLPPVPTPPRKGRGGLIIGILLVLVVLLAGGLGVSLYALNARNHQQQTQVGTTPTAAAAPSLTPTPHATILFQDPLTSNTNEWANDTHCFFQGKSYHVKDGYICYAPAGVITNANISVQAKQVAGSLLYPYGIGFRRTGPGNWYEFDIDSNSKWAFIKHDNGTTSTIVDYTPNAAIKGGLNTVNTLMVQARGSHFVFFVNGAKVGEATDTTFSSGLSGLVAGGADTEAAFNNFEITAAS